MDIKELLLSAGSTALNTFAPGAGTLVHGLLSKYVDDDLPPPEQMTGDDAAAIVSTKLSGEQQAVIFGRKVDLAIQQSVERINESNNAVKIRNMDHTEIIKGVSPRPEAVKKMVSLLALQVYFILGIMSVCVVANSILLYKGKEIIEISSIIPDFAIMGTIMGTPALVIMRYFGARSQDKQVAGTVMVGGDPSKLVGLGQAIKQRIAGFK